MLKDDEYNFDVKENQDELTENQLNRLAYALRKKFLEQEIREEWLNNLNVIKRLDFKEYYENLQLMLSSKRQFKENFLRDFQKAIEFVFELVTGRQIISELETEKEQDYIFIKNKKEIAEDLIKRFGFLEDIKQQRNFEIFLRVFVSRYIYDTIKDPKFESVMGAYKGELTPFQIDKLALSLKKVISYQQINDEWFENFNRFRKRRFLKNYQRLQTYIQTDQLYSVSFLDYLKSLIRLVDGLISGKIKDSELKKNELIVARDLRCGDPFQSIGASNPLFKPNLLIILGRIVYLIAKTMESARESNEIQANCLEADTDKILNQIIPEIATRNRINDKLLKKLYKISIEDFQKDYEKLKLNLKSDQICFAQVSFYLKWVIETILNILSGGKSVSKFSIYEKAFVRDLKNFSFDDLINDKKEGAVILSNASKIDAGGRNSIKIKNSLLWKYIQSRNENNIGKYNTMDLLSDLYIEINRYPEMLASLFPDRVSRFTDRDLSIIWGKYKNFILKWKQKMKNDKQKCFYDEDLKHIKIILKENLSAKAIGCIKIIELYKSKKLNNTEFIDQLKKELGRVSNKIVLTMEEYSLILGGYVNFINDILGKIYTPSHQRYNPDYKFSIERLDAFKDNLLTILGYRAKNCFEIFEKYKKFNPDLKRYSHQQYTIEKPHFFEKIDNPIIAYFFGLMCADGYKSTTSYRIGIELSIKDKDRLILFAKSIGFDINRIIDKTKFYRIRGVLKYSQMSILTFICKEMYLDLDNNQFSSSKEERKCVPNCILEVINKAKKEASEIGIDWMNTYWGMISLSWLLGFYDGDGTLDKRGKQMSVRIYSANKEFLEKIKEVFGITNKVLTNTEFGAKRLVFNRTIITKGYYLLTLGPNLFNCMLNSFSDSMKRKRPIKISK